MESSKHLDEARSEHGSLKTLDVNQKEHCPSGFQIMETSEHLDPTSCKEPNENKRFGKVIVEEAENAISRESVTMQEEAIEGEDDRDEGEIEGDEDGEEVEGEVEGEEEGEVEGEEKGEVEGEGEGEVDGEVEGEVEGEEEGEEVGEEVGEEEGGEEEEELVESLNEDREIEIENSPQGEGELEGDIKDSEELGEGLAEDEDDNELIETNNNVASVRSDSVSKRDSAISNTRASSKNTETEIISVFPRKAKANTILTNNYEINKANNENINDNQDKLLLEDSTCDEANDGANQQKSVKDNHKEPPKSVKDLPVLGTLEEDNKSSETNIPVEKCPIEVCSFESINFSAQVKPVERGKSERFKQKPTSAKRKEVCAKASDAVGLETADAGVEGQRGKLSKSESSGDTSKNAPLPEPNCDKSFKSPAVVSEKEDTVECMEVDPVDEVNEEADLGGSSGTPQVKDTLSNVPLNNSTNNPAEVSVPSASVSSGEVTIKEEADSPAATSVVMTPSDVQQAKSTTSSLESHSTVQSSVESALNKILASVDGNKHTTASNSLGQSTRNANEDDSSASNSNTLIDESGDSEALKKSPSSSRTCAECGAAKGLKYQVLFQGKTRFLCSDICFKVFRGKQKLAPPPPSQGGKKSDACGICNREIKNGQGYFPFSGDSKPVCSEECMVKYQQAHTPKPSCAQCQAPIEGRTKCLTWETMEFCNEDCLGVYQSTMGSHCACCNAPVQRLSLGKYCVRFGADIRQFCSGKCLEQFKKGLKVCTFCQKDMSNTTEGFLGPVGDNFRDFCTSLCMEQYEALNEATASKPHAQKCSVCQKLAPVKVQVKHKGRDHILCSDPCIAAFRYTQKIYATLCDTCNKFFNNEPTCLQIDNSAKKFCTKTCLNLFVLSHRKIVPCTWCKVKKYNFDMIERVDNTNNSQLFCSLNCLSLFRVSLNATSSRCVNCDHCRLHLPAQYHLTMSDASIRNFCSYPCVIKFQGQFTSVPTLTTVTPSLNRQQGPTPVGKATLAPPQASATAKNGNNHSPVIANVMSLAPAGVTAAQPASSQKKLPQPLPLTPGQATKGVTSVGTGNSSTTTNGMPVVREVHREVIVAPPVPRMVKNKMIMCKPLMQNKGVACKPHPCHKETQTDDTLGAPVIVPLPIPIFVPVPVHMYSRHVPFPMPFPIPIPVPIFIPTTRTTTAKVIKDIFDIQEKVPSNPFEAELLLMAEMVAAEDEKNPPKSEDEEEMHLDDVLRETKAVKASDIAKLPEVLEDLESAVPVQKPPVVHIPNKVVSPVVQLTQLSSNFALNDNSSQDPKATTGEAKRKGQASVIPTAKRGAVKRGRARGRGRGRKRQKIVDSDDTSDEEWLPSEPVLEVAPYSPPSGPVPNEDQNKAPSPVPLKSAATAVDPTPKAATPEPSSKAAVSKPPVLVPVAPKPPVLAPVTPTLASTITPTLVSSLPGPKADAKAAGDGVSPDAHLCLKYMFGANAWKHWVVQKNVQLEKGSQTRRLKLFKTDLLQMSPDELNYALCLFVKEVRKPNLEEYAPDSIYYLCLGIQLFLFENGRVDNIFTDSYYEKFTECLNDVLLKHDIIGTLCKEAHFVSRIEEEILWESKQLGAHSPQVLLNTLMYFNTKQFHLQSVDDHLQLSFTYIMKGWRKISNHIIGVGGVKVTRCAVLRYYPPPARGVPESKKVWREDAFTYEQEENFDNPLRCPVKLYEFYLSKCPESIRTRNDLFYMCPERSCVPDSPVWYATQALAKDTMVKMLQRIYLVREISVPDVPSNSQEKAGN